MKRVVFLLPFFLFFLLSCKQPSNNTGVEGTNAVSDTSSSEEPLKGSNCYVYINGKDSVMLQLNISGKKVTGNLVYNFFEKDRNTGSLEKAMLNGDTLFADYRFQSEGKESIRKVAFMLADSTAKEGYGEMIEKKGMMVFKNPANIRFNRSFVLSRTTCD